MRIDRSEVNKKGKKSKMRSLVMIQHQGIFNYFVVLQYGDVSVEIRSQNCILNMTSYSNCSSVRQSSGETCTRMNF